MNLTPEQRKIGKENFQTVASSDLTRREFLQGSLAAAAIGGGGLGAFYFGYSKVANPVRVGVIGTGDEGSVLIGAHNPEYVDIIAIADIRPYNVHRAFHGDTSSARGIAERPGLIKACKYANEDQAKAHVKVYTPGSPHGDTYLDLLANPDIEGVIIALPLHLHEQAAMDAIKAGKHVLTEKLMAQTVHQCKQMGRVAKQQKKLLATGHQRHYSVLYDNAVDMIRRGLLGDLHHIRAQWHRGNLPGNDSWAPPLPNEKMKEELAKTEKELAEAKKMKEELAKIEKELAEAKGARVDALTKKRDLLVLRLLDIDVVAEKFGYQSKTLNGGYVVSPLEELIRWRLWDRTGAGLMAELGSHQLDASGIFCSAIREDKKKARPLSVTGVGGRHTFQEDREVDDHVYCLYEFPGPGYDSDKNKKIVVSYSSINGNAFGEYGEIVFGTKGTLILEKEQETMIYPTGGAGTSTSVTVTKGKDDKPVMTSAESGGGPAMAVGKAALDGPVSRGYREEIEHWAWCIRNFDYEVNQPKCKPEVAMADAIIALTSNMAMRENRRIEFKDEWFDIDSDETPEGVKPRIAAG